MLLNLACHFIAFNSIIKLPIIGRSDASSRPILKYLCHGTFRSIYSRKMKISNQNRLRFVFPNVFTWPIGCIFSACFFFLLPETLSSPFKTLAPPPPSPTIQYQPPLPIINESVPLRMFLLFDSKFSWFVLRERKKKNGGSVPPQRRPCGLFLQFYYNIWSLSKIDLTKRKYFKSK